MAVPLTRMVPVVGSGETVTPVAEQRKSVLLFVALRAGLSTCEPGTAWSVRRRAVQPSTSISMSSTSSVSAPAVLFFTSVSARTVPAAVAVNVCVN